MANRWAIVAALCAIAGCLGPPMSCARFERREFPVGSACAPDSVAANTPVDFLVYHSCDDCVEARDFECGLIVDGTDVYVTATREERASACVGCFPSEGLCTLPALPAGSYTLHFDDSWSGESWSTTVIAGPATGAPACVCRPPGFPGCCPNTCG